MSKKKQFEVFTKEEAKVIFAGTEDYFTPGPIETCDKKPMDDRQLFYKGNKEIVIECEDKELLMQIFDLRNLQNTFFPKINPVIDWLEQKQIPYYIANSKSTKV